MIAFRFQSTLTQLPWRNTGAWSQSGGGTLFRWITQKTCMVRYPSFAEVLNVLCAVPCVTYVLCLQFGCITAPWAGPTAVAVTRPISSTGVCGVRGLAPAASTGAPAQSTSSRPVLLLTYTRWGTRLLTCAVCEPLILYLVLLKWQFTQKWKLCHKFLNLILYFFTQFPFLKIFSCLFLCELSF